MKKLILAITTVALVFGATTTAEAAPFLSMKQGKRAARADIRYITSGDPFYMSCTRRSQSAIDCEWESYGYGMLTCDGRIRERKTWTGYVMFSVRRSANCWFPDEKFDDIDFRP